MSRSSSWGFVLWLFRSHELFLLISRRRFPDPRDVSDAKRAKIMGCSAAVIKCDNQFSDEVGKGNKVAKTNANGYYHCDCKEGA